MDQPKKIFSAAQIKEADRFTIQHEPVSSIDLMERAALKYFEWIGKHFTKENKFIVFCGPGNNGGDGLAIARLLLLSGFTAQVYIIETGGKYSEDFCVNEARLRQLNYSINKIRSANDLPKIMAQDIVIDAIFGTGLSKPAIGVAAETINAINKSNATIISIDMPSGLFADIASDHSSAIINATHTISFQFPKLAFFFPENSTYVGEWEILDIGLSQKFIENESTTHFFLTTEFIRTIVKPKDKFSHKGTFGHAILIAGSYGKIGAAVLAARACLRSGIGLLTTHVPECGYKIMQVANPEAMVSVDNNKRIIGDEIESTNFSAIGIGSGIGKDELTQKALQYLLTNTDRPLVIDADALNILSMHKDWIEHVLANSILTPHPKEFERLAGKTTNDFERHQLQIDFSKKNKLFIILKGAHTCITTPSGESYFNTTGNPGMAKGGSGDVLTGVLTSLLAQGHNPLETCLLGVFIHGFAGDLAKESLGETGMIAGDICNFLPAAFKHFEK